MIYAILHFMGGYCRVLLSGSHQERFLNLCVSRQLLIWRLTREGTHYIFYVSRAGLKEMEEIAAKTGCQYRVLCKKGVPFLLLKYRKRKILLASVLLSAFMLYILSLFLWQIETEGCYSHSPEEMMDYLHELGIQSGKRLSEISCHTLEEQIREDFSDIAWVSCDLKGTLLTVSIKETLDTEAVKDEGVDVPCNLIASKEGKIDSIVVRSGSAQVKKGDTVKEGDVLISGVIELYDDGGELLENVLVKAEGEITATTKICYEDSFSMLYYEKEYTGRSTSSYQVRFGNKLLTIPALSQISFFSSFWLDGLKNAAKNEIGNRANNKAEYEMENEMGDETADEVEKENGTKNETDNGAETRAENRTKNKDEYDFYDEETVQTMLHIGTQLYLPITLYVTTRSECLVQNKTYTESEAKSEAESRLDIFLEEYEEKGVEILKKNVKIECDENTCHAKGTITVREHFGKIQEIQEEEFQSQEEVSEEVS